MSKEVKFRGKQYSSGKWIYGSLLRVDDNFYIVQNNDVEVDGHHLVFITDVPMFVDKDTTGQFTGLYDKNGTEIYEGDIVRYYREKLFSQCLCCDPSFYQHEFYIKEYQSVVKFEDGCFCVEHDYLYGAAFESVEQAMGILERTDESGPYDSLGKEINEDIVGYEVIGNIHDNPELLRKEEE